MHIDRATKFSTEFLGALENRLHVHSGADGVPLFYPDEVNHFSIQLLRRDLADLCRSSTLSDAVLDMETCQRDHQVIQSTGVGFAADFDLFAKMGLLLGDRLVLWDTVVQGMFSSPDEQIDTMALGALACQLLLLKPVVARGGLVLLPHPVSWLERARYYYHRVAQAGDVSTDFLGFVNARALLDEGIALHPYSVATDRQQARWTRKAIVRDHDNLKDEAVDYHEQLVDFLLDERFVFLRNVSVDRFHKELGARENRRDLRMLLSSGPRGESIAERRVYFRETLSQLRKSIDSQNKDTLLRRVSLGGATVGAVGASLALLCDAVTSAAFFAMLTATMGAASRWVPVVEKLFAKSKSPTLYQVFYCLEKAAEEEFLAEQSDRCPLLDAHVEE